MRSLSSSSSSSQSSSSTIVIAIAATATTAAAIVYCYLAKRQSPNNNNNDDEDDTPSSSSCRNKIDTRLDDTTNTNTAASSFSSGLSSPTSTRSLLLSPRTWSGYFTSSSSNFSSENNNDDDGHDERKCQYLNEVIRAFSQTMKRSKLLRNQQQQHHQQQQHCHSCHTSSMKDTLSNIIDDEDTDCFNLLTDEDKLPSPSNSERHIACTAAAAIIDDSAETTPPTVLEGDVSIATSKKMSNDNNDIPNTPQNIPYIVATSSGTLTILPSTTTTTTTVTSPSSTMESLESSPPSTTAGDDENSHCKSNYSINHGDSSNNNNNSSIINKITINNLDINDIDINSLLQACHAHINLLRSVGGSILSLVANDLENNLNKVQTVVNAAASSSSSPSSSENNSNNNHHDDDNCCIWTLRSILVYEKNITPHVHYGNILGETSAAMGLLWIRRSLAFQLHLLKLLVITPSASSDEIKGGEVDDKKQQQYQQYQQHPREMANESYQLHLAPYHNWILRSCFKANMIQMPRSRNIFLSKFGQVELHELGSQTTTSTTSSIEVEIVQKIQELIVLLEPLLDVWKFIFVQLNLEDTRRV